MNGFEKKWIHFERPFFPKIGNQEEVVRLDLIEGRRIIEIKAAL